MTAHVIDVAHLSNRARVLEKLNRLKARVNPTWADEARAHADNTAAAGITAALEATQQGWYRQQDAAGFIEHVPVDVRSALVLLWRSGGLLVDHFRVLGVNVEDLTPDGEEPTIEGVLAALAGRTAPNIDVPGVVWDTLVQTATTHLVELDRIEDRVTSTFTAGRPERVQLAREIAALTAALPGTEDLGADEAVLVELEAAA